MSEKQMSRVAGVPRLKLPIWKAAAAQFFAGKEPSRSEQQNQGKQTKVALLRELAASDPAVKSWIIKFATDLRARDARQQAAEQGFIMPEKLGFISLFWGDRPDLSVMDRTVICMEKPNAAELLEKLATLYPDGDPPEVAEREVQKIADLVAHTKAWEDRERNQPKTCSNCGKPATRTIRWDGPGSQAGKDIPWCDNDHRPGPGQIPAPADHPLPAVTNHVPLSPANLTSRAAALRALGQAIEDGGPIPQRPRADYGPTVPPEPKER